MIGRARTVSGDIDLGRGATATSLSSVSGEIHIGAGGRVAGPARTVSGLLELEKGADVRGDALTVSGDIQVSAAHVGGRIDTVDGDVDIGPGARVDGDLVVDWPSGWRVSERVPYVTIRTGSVVKGTLRFMHAVHLYVSDRATIGPVIGANVQRFSGDTPPP